MFTVLLQFGHLDGILVLNFFLFRPPGHHGQRSAANGFCVFNNVAIAARYAKQNYNLNRWADICNDSKICVSRSDEFHGLIFFSFFRILIVDWDVHHGQGVQYCFEEDPRWDLLSQCQRFLGCQSVAKHVPKSFLLIISTSWGLMAHKHCLFVQRSLFLLASLRASDLLAQSPRIRLHQRREGQWNRL